MFLEAFFSHSRKLFSKFPYKIFVIALHEIIGLQNFSLRPCQGGSLCPRLNFKRSHVAISEGSHVAVGISSKATDIDIDKFFCCDRTCTHQQSRHMQNEYPTSLKVQQQRCSASLVVVYGHLSASRFFEHEGACWQPQLSPLESFSLLSHDRFRKQTYFV